MWLNENDHHNNSKDAPMSLLAIFGIGFAELIVLLMIASVVGMVILGVVVAIVGGNKGRKDRKD